jgi:hypothetical protein
MPSKVEARRVRRYQRSAPGWAVRAARDLGLKPSTIEGRVHCTSARRVQDEVATILRRLIETGNLAIAQKVFAPIEAAMAALPVPALSPAVIEAAVVPDEMESIARARYQADPANLSHLDGWIERVRQQRAASLPLLLALEAERSARV